MRASYGRRCFHARESIVCLQTKIETGGKGCKEQDQTFAHPVKIISSGVNPEGCLKVKFKENKRLSKRHTKCGTDCLGNVGQDAFIFFRRKFSKIKILLWEEDAPQTVFERLL
ncbi:hypothetical protein NPIL_314581 [Nephila pilipes]|uniref:Uncharacterized protein n=1 Tax=Nephila pilipes TaxID=299642 RepID=A0A8X6U081_NEPPI|nr:hypothetical protein NPIL_314581 [Nephila pilipes]